jgi:hypothetical protein
VGPVAPKPEPVIVTVCPFETVPLNPLILGAAITPEGKSAQNDARIRLKMSQETLMLFFGFFFIPLLTFLKRYPGRNYRILKV